MRRIALLSPHPAPGLRAWALAGWVGAIVLASAGCWSTDQGEGSDDPTEATRPGQVTITGAGATFPYPIYARWFSIYNREFGVRINYQSIGSGGGIRQMIEGTVDFG
ncbi:MAG: hypothetical protein EA350_13280, partial [Gemmatimonadales bacterium]